MADKVYLGDSAVLETDLTDAETGEPISVDSVRFEFLDPNSLPTLVDSVPLNPVAGYRVGLYQADFPFDPYDIVEYDGVSWSKIGTFNPPSVIDGVGTFVYPPELTYDPGIYQGRAQFLTSEGLTKSAKLSFEVVDPMEVPSATILGRIVDHAWFKLEDLFDSELGGPWLTDETKKAFNKDKLTHLVPDALYVINNEYQPTTTFDETNWPEAHIPLASQALLVEAIYHLVRSYVEQPTPQGQLSWFDRRDYFTRWQTVLQSEEQKLFRLADIFKLQYTGFGTTSILIGGYAAPTTRLSKLWRTRYPRWIGPWGV